MARVSSVRWNLKVAYLITKCKCKLESDNEQGTGTNPQLKKKIVYDTIYGKLIAEYKKTA